MNNLTYVTNQHIIISIRSSAEQQDNKSENYRQYL